MTPGIKFCPTCGCAAPRFAIPAGDNRKRYICDECGYIHYQNPRIIVGCVPRWKDQILLCKRAIEPRHGYWTLPAGFMENDESLEQGAARETEEEAGAVVEIGELYTSISVRHISQVHFFFLADMTSADFSAGEESLEVRLFNRADIPWNELAFPTVGYTLKRYLEDEQRGQFKLHQHSFDIPVWKGKKSVPAESSSPS